MSSNACYLLNFPSKEDAAAALEDSGGEVETGGGPFGHRIFLLSHGQVGLRAQQANYRPSLVMVASNRTYVPTELLLDRNRWVEMPDTQYLEAMSILADLDFLRTAPGLRTGTLLYGSQQMTLVEPYEPVDAAFIGSMRKLIKSRLGRAFVFDENWEMMNQPPARDRLDAWANAWHTGS